MSRVQVVAIAWLAFVIGLIAAHTFFPQRSGVLALTEVFEPYIALTAIVAAVVAALSRFRIGRVLTVVIVGALLVRCVPTLVSNPGPSGGPSGGEQLSVMTWNVLADNAAERAVAAVKSSEANIVGLQELQPDAARALEADPTLSESLPYKALEPEATVRGVGLLSAFPILEHSVSRDPPFLRAVVQPVVADPIAVFVVHPLPAQIKTIAGVPVSLDTTKRDADIAQIRMQVDADLAAGRQVLVIGDMNTTEREPAYRDMSRDLKDSHLEAGIGPGLTWRPPGLEFLPFGLLRIDYVFVTSALVVESTYVDCYPGSDHCAVHATLDTGAHI